MTKNRKRTKRDFVAESLYNAIQRIDHLEAVVEELILGRGPAYGKPTKMDDGSWCVASDSGLRAGTPIAVHTRQGRGWIAYVDKEVECGVYTTKNERLSRGQAIEAWREEFATFTSAARRRQCELGRAGDDAVSSGGYGVLDSGLDGTEGCTTATDMEDA